MIVKEITHKMRWNKQRKISNLIAYIFDERKVPKDGVFKRNICGYNHHTWTEQFLINDDRRVFNHINRSVIRHTVLSFSPSASSHLTSPILKDIGKYYGQKRSNSLMVGAIHEEEGKPTHLHLMISSVDIHGGNTRLSHKKFRELKIEMERFIEERYPEVHRTSYVEHNPDQHRPP